MLAHRIVGTSGCNSGEDSHVGSRSDSWVVRDGSRDLSTIKLVVRGFWELDLWCRCFAIMFSFMGKYTGEHLVNSGILVEGCIRRQLHLRQISQESTKEQPHVRSTRQNLVLQGWYLLFTKILMPKSPSQPGLCWCSCHPLNVVRCVVVTLLLYQQSQCRRLYQSMPSNFIRWSLWRSVRGQVTIYSSLLMRVSLKVTSSVPFSVFAFLWRIH